MLNSEKPSDFLLYMKKYNLLKDFPELSSLIITPQEPDWHPEGSVWKHTLMVVDVAVEFRSLYPNEKELTEFMFGALCHDLGKPYTTAYINSKFKSKMHDTLGLPPARTLLVKLGLEFAIPQVEKYIMEHLKPMQLYKVKNDVSAQAIKKLAERINIQDLVNLSRCDHWGRTDEEARLRQYPAGDWLLEVACKNNI